MGMRWWWRWWAQGRASWRRWRRRIDFLWKRVLFLESGYWKAGMCEEDEESEEDASQCHPSDEWTSPEYILALG
jgi:hypothetical protein